MLLPDNIHPEQTVYFNGAFVLQALREKDSQSVMDLYLLTKGKKDMSMPVFTLCLDWLFLLNLVEFDGQGKIQLCS